MFIGIDFGTTRTIVAYADRGNYPVFLFRDSRGDYSPYLPTALAYDPKNSTQSDGLVFGSDALRAIEEYLPGAVSLKRVLARTDARPDTMISLGQQKFSLEYLVRTFFTHIHRVLSDEFPEEEFHAYIGIPAHASSMQRFLTIESARAAGFDVLGLMNEPSAAGFEFTHQHEKLLTRNRHNVLVYDLGGGTFDASYVQGEATHHRVLQSHGNNLLGGDDFDRELARLALLRTNRHFDSLGPAMRTRILLHAREAKEQVLPQTRHIPVLVEDETIMVDTADFYAAIQGLVEETIRVMRPLLVPTDNGYELPDDAAALYVVGGASQLPYITRVLREYFGRRVRRSPYGSQSTAIGLAIAADPAAGYELDENLHRGIGVFREMRAGELISFDPLIMPDTTLEHGSSLSRTYRSAHNVGVYRFAEFTELSDEGVPTAGLSPLPTLVFPFDPALRGNTLPEDIDVVRVDDNSSRLIEETLNVDSSGMITVTITDVEDGYSQSIALK